MFVTVKYGDDQSKIFNANCRNDILLHSIKEKCKCNSNDIVELSDEDGIVKDLRRHPFEYGVDFLKERETLILLKIEGLYHENDFDRSRTIYRPMLVGMENNTEFVETLNPKVEGRSRPISARSGVNSSDDQKNVKNNKQSKQQNKKADRKTAKSPKK
ncbi:unnamed protein product [Mytilus edulis]|uniref:Uncharacterized protein n=2 Tax=Mytilus TaxID=6548 RepID=A0A8B6CZ92_MYTGA|nr:unnamed protein product [Mytilus edulis]VDI11789.1 Hypothetical predicted protein [Mytilus galloprovincialis]